VKFGGQGRLNKKEISAKKIQMKDGNGKVVKQSYELEMVLPPLSVVVFKYDYSC
jgi:hypothetical protein